MTTEKLERMKTTAAIKLVSGVLVGPSGEDVRFGHMHPLLSEAGVLGEGWKVFGIDADGARHDMQDWIPGIADGEVTWPQEEYRAAVGE